MKLNDLPNEILLEIMALLSGTFSSINCMRLVCKKWNEIIGHANRNVVYRKMYNRIYVKASWQGEEGDCYGSLVSFCEYYGDFKFLIKPTKELWEKRLLMLRKAIGDLGMQNLSLRTNRVASFQVPIGSKGKRHLKSEDEYDNNDDNDDDNDDVISNNNVGDIHRIQSSYGVSNSDSDFESEVDDESRHLLSIKTFAYSRWVETVLKRKPDYANTDRKFAEFLVTHLFVNGQDPEKSIFGIFGNYECYGMRVKLIWHPFLSSSWSIFEHLGFSLLIFASSTESRTCLGLILRIPEVSKDSLVNDRMSMASSCHGGSSAFGCNLYDVLEFTPEALACKNHGSFTDFCSSWFGGIESGVYLHTPSWLWKVPSLGEFASTRVTSITGSIQGLFRINTGTCCAFRPDIGSKCLHTYRIEIVYEQAAVEHSSVQLIGRRWFLRHLDGVTEEVEGDGVVGNYPIFERSGDRFEYMSYCSGDLDNPVVEMYGELMFTPGTIERSTGNYFWISVPTMRFERHSLVLVKPFLLSQHNHRNNSHRSSREALSI